MEFGTENSQTDTEHGNTSENGLQIAFEWMEDIAIALGILCIIMTFVVRQISVDGESMQPNYLDGERVLITGQANNLEAGDVVVIVNTIERGPIIKRIIATEGQTVDFDEEQGCVLVDGVAVDDSQYNIENGITYTYQSMSYEQTTYPLVVPAGHVFVLGDNRTNSLDSRAFGVVDERNILGKTLWIFLPISEFGAAK